MTLSGQLANWAIKFNIALVALTALLAILRVLVIVPTLPKDARTALRTSRSTKKRVLKPGFYWHRGLAKGIEHILYGKSVTSVKVDINVDGLPLGTSGGNSLWPILGKVN